MRKDYRQIYASEAERYDALVSREDHEGNLPDALRELINHNIDCAVELGAGTGRLTRLIAPLAARVVAFEGSAHMAAHARLPPNATISVADNAALPAGDASADLAIAGWTIGHLVGWHPDDWASRADAVLQEMLRVTRPSGAVVVIETLGTGTERAGPPNPLLAEYYARLEKRHGFTRRAIRTDYRFVDLDEAVALAGFFFGDALAERIRQNDWVILPEHTGIWHRARTQARE